MSALPGERIDVPHNLQYKPVNIDISTSYYPTYQIGWAINATAAMQSGTSNNTYWNWNQLLEYNKTFGKHTLV